MPQCVVIADDLTGANATGVLLKKMNYKAYTVMNTERIELSTLTDCDCVLYPTDSRGVEPTIAYNRVHNVCNQSVLTVRCEGILAARRMPCWIVWGRNMWLSLRPAFHPQAES